MCKDCKTINDNNDLTQEHNNRAEYDLCDTLVDYIREKHNCGYFSAYSAIKDATEIIAFFFSERGRALTEKYSDISERKLVELCDEGLIYNVFKDDDTYPF